MGKTIEVIFGGAPRACRLGIGELRELQSKCNAGPATIFARLLSFQPQAADIKRPRPDDFELGIRDPDFLSQFQLFSTLRSIGGDWRVDDVRETIRLGLIGGGMTPTDAMLLVMQYIDDRSGGLLENAGAGADILGHALNGEPGDSVGKPAAGKDEAQATTA